MSLAFETNYFYTKNNVYSNDFYGATPKSKKSEKPYSFFGDRFGDYSFNIKQRKVKSFDQILLDLFINLLFTDTINYSSNFKFKPRYTSFKAENNYKPKAESNYKPKAESNYKPEAESDYKPKAEGNYKYKAEGNYNVRTNSNAVTEAKAAATTLGLTKDLNKITLAEINTAYRKKALKYHPDKNKAPEAAATFRKMTEARDVLLAYTNKNK